jgi:hypothetical protein
MNNGNRSDTAMTASGAARGEIVPVFGMKVSSA